MKEKRLLLLLALLCVTAVFVYRGSTEIKVSKQESLRQVFGPVEGFELEYQSTLEPSIYSFLDLDDYASSGYKKDGTSIGLYIGYYFSLDKVSAAHSPLVCFPGQGWAISKPVKHTMEVGKHTIKYAEMVASLGSRKELILYWYQAGETTSPEIYLNKFHAIINKLQGKSQEHAFVRVSVPFTDETIEEARKSGHIFMSNFYSNFLTYISDI